MVDVQVIETSTLGDRSYLAHDGQVGLVVDPQRDIDRILALAGSLQVRITHVAETHIHNDYVSGGLELARITGAAYLVAADDEVAFERVPVSGGDVFELSDRMRLRVLHTPGHTFHHLSYVLEEVDGGDPVGVFTGGSLLYGTTGRTDLLGQEHAETLARAQHASARKLAELLPQGTRVWPTHGFGSFCSATQAHGDASTIGTERGVNPALRLDEESFVSETLAGLDAYPAYYAHMGVRNRSGPDPLDLRPAHRADAAELRRRLDAGEWVVDLRSRKAFAASHLAGTVSLGLDGAMATWLGWLTESQQPVTLLGDSPEQVAAAQRELARIGIDRPEASATGAPQDWAQRPDDLRELPLASFSDLVRARGGDAPAGLPYPDVVLDVRTTNEWNASHVDGAVHIPLYELPRRRGEIPDGAVWVHCGSGYRAAAAASLLQAAGREAVSIDDLYGNAEDAGLHLVSG